MVDDGEQEEEEEGRREYVTRDALKRTRVRGIREEEQ